MQRIAPCLWFDGQAEEAATFYTSLFPNSRILSVERSPGDYPAGKAGDVLLVRFELFGETYTALNGGPDHPFSDAVSFQIECDSQEEVDRYWAALGEGGQEIACGWINDRFGLSWQVVPLEIYKYIMGTDAEGSARAYAVMQEMIKLDIDVLRRAYEG